MKDNRDFDFIKNKFEKENITAPPSIDENAVMDRIKGITQKKIGFYQTKAFKGIVASAACIAVAVTAVTVAKPYISEKIDNDPAQENSQQVMNTFASIDEIKSAVKKIEKQGSVNYSVSETLIESATKDTAAVGGASSYADTYKQVDAVDEGDIIKNDGKYIYYVNSIDNTIVIFGAHNDNAEVVSSIDDFKINNSDDDSYAENSTGENTSCEYISDIYIYKDKLIVNTSKTIFKDADYYDCDDLTAAYIYDISDIEKPKKINSFAQSGCYTSSRMIGSQLYIVSNEYIYIDQCKDDDDYVPYVCSGKDLKKESIAVSDICYLENPNSASYLVVSSINVESAKKSADTKALFGAGTDIYCNENNLYVAMNEISWQGLIENHDKIDSKVNIVKISLSENEIKFTAKGEVDGNTLNQFSMDEKDGNLRVATTSYNKEGKEINNLFVLDESLSKIGEVTGFAETESIKAVRFLGDAAYVITYEQTDPLFVIDLSEPSNPQIKGEVKITGFSSLLVPVDENTLLGIGYSTDDGENDIDMEITDGIKLALFDISNPESPKVMDSYVMKNAYSDAQYNHHALVVNSDKGYYAIPYDWNDYENYDEEHGAITFEVKDGKINVTNKFKISSNETVSRCTYIDDTLYVLDYSADIYCFNV